MPNQMLLDPSSPRRTLFERARILIVDDQMPNVRLLERHLMNAGCPTIKTTTDSRLALPMVHEFAPDLILLDLMMPYLDGFAVMEQLRTEMPDGDFLPVMVLTADIEPHTKKRVLASGARDFITKPFDAVEVMLRAQNLLEMRYLHRSLRTQNARLEERVVERTRNVQESQLEMLDRLARAAEFRDDDTGQHTYRVGERAALLAKKLGMPAHEVDLLRRAAPLHDVGKIGIADNILLKPEKLTREEFETMKTHTTIGARLLSGGSSQMVQMAEQIAISHHERWDGSGYPNGSKGEDIPLVGRIVALADVFDALTCERPYKPAWEVEHAIEEISNQDGRQFDPQIVAAFLEMQREGLWPVYSECDTPRTPDNRSQKYSE